MKRRSTTRRATKKSRRNRNRKSTRRFTMKGGVLHFESISKDDESKVIVTVMNDLEEAPITTSLERARSLYE